VQDVSFFVDWLRRDMANFLISDNTAMSSISTVSGAQNVYGVIRGNTNPSGGPPKLDSNTQALIAAGTIVNSPD
jgi:hypothetical protein